MDNCGVDLDRESAEADFATLTTPGHQSKMADDWIPIGRGTDREQLQKIISKLESAWAGRWAYRIDERSESKQEPYQLLVRHI